jgi:hypothetical protein
VSSASNESPNSGSILLLLRDYERYTTIHVCAFLDRNRKFHRHPLDIVLDAAYSSLSTQIFNFELNFFFKKSFFRHPVFELQTMKNKQIEF